MFCGMNLRGWFFLAVSPWLMTAAVCRAIFARPDDVPVGRLLKAAEAALAKTPSSAEAHYTIARIHYLAFSRGTETVPAYLPSESDPQLQVPGEYLTRNWLESKRWKKAREIARAELGKTGATTSLEESRVEQAATERHRKELVEQNWRPVAILNGEERALHAEGALAEFREAIRLDPTQPLYVLGLASLIEQITDWKGAEKPAGLSPLLIALGYAQARMEYLKAFNLAVEKDGQVKFLGVEGLVELVSYEGGKGYLRLSDRARASGRLSDDAVRRKMQAHLEKIRKLPQDAITPIVFALRPATGIADLLKPELSVEFDLRGYGSRETWSWVRPTTALLVWDPSGRGDIVSGRQLFGGYTFQMFQKDGYDALAALDDDGDGVLRGAELKGIRAWFDANSDGRSQPGEVRDLAELGIIGIAVRATAQDGPHPMNSSGLIFADGRTLPTWDWIVAPEKK